MLTFSRVMIRRCARIAHHALLRKLRIRYFRCAFSQSLAVSSNTALFVHRIYAVGLENQTRARRWNRCFQTS